MSDTVYSWSTQNVDKTILDRNFFNAKTTSRTRQSMLNVYIVIVLKMIFFSVKSITILNHYLSSINFHNSVKFLQKRMIVRKWSLTFNETWKYCYSAYSYDYNIWQISWTLLLLIMLYMVIHAYTYIYRNRHLPKIILS